MLSLQISTVCDGAQNKGGKETEPDNGGGETGKEGGTWLRVDGRTLKGFGAQGRVAGVDDEHFDHAASHLGKAVGIANLLRGTAYHAAR